MIFYRRLDQRSLRNILTTLLIARYSLELINIINYFSLAVDIIFEPHAEGQFNYNLLVDVKKKPSPLQLNIKGEGYKLSLIHI